MSLLAILATPVSSVSSRMAVFALAVVMGLSASPARADVRIMCVGDSITAGYTDNPRWSVPFEFGYRSGLYTRLNEAGYPVQFVGASPEPWDGRFGLPTNTPSLDLRVLGQDHHRGYGGWGTTNILGNIGQWLSDDNPDVVLLMIGINDMSPFGVGLAKAKIAISNIVQTIVAAKPDADVIVAQITPTVTYSQDIVNYNTYICDTLIPFFQAQGKRVSTVNQYTNLLTNGTIDPALFSNALNHPNAVAYDRIAQTWLDGIQAVRPASPGLDPPTNLSASGRDGQVYLNWAPSAGSAGYKVKRSTASGGPYIPVGATEMTNYTDSPLINGEMCYYIVTATNGMSESANSLETSARPLPPVAPVPAFLPSGDSGGGFNVDPEAGASFRIDAMGGIQYRIVYKDNLLSAEAWSPVTPPADGWIEALANGPMTWIDASATGVPCRFYRIEAR